MTEHPTPAAQDDEPEPMPPVADPWHAQQQRNTELASLQHSDAAQAVRRYLAADGNGIRWSELLREIGGIGNLAVLLDDEEQPHPERINSFVDRIFARTHGQPRRLRGGMTVTYGLRNRE